jgi:hypothetical protein
MKAFSDMGDDELAAALRSLRPEPSPAFAAALDQRVAAGFPRRSPQAARNPFARFVGWLSGGSRLRLLIPAGSVAIAAIAVATVIVATKHPGFEAQSSVSLSDSAPLSSESGKATQGHASGPGRAEAGQPAAHGAPTQHSSSGGNADSSVLQYEVEIPESAAATREAEEYAPSAGGINGGNAAGNAHREVERAADIVIGAKPDQVGEASSQVFEAVHAYDGIVLNSSTRDGSGAHAEATFELLIPSGKIGDAMAAFSRIGEVVNRHEATNDITAPTVGASERLQDSEARIEGLLAQLSEATTESEREVVEAEIVSERRHAAGLKSHLSELKRRANLSRVSVRIVSGKGALTPGGTGNDSWGIGKAVGEAGHLLSVAAGVTIVGLAVLVPLMLLAFLVWLAGRAWTRRARERALT